jgi:hypothetical protein
MTCMSFALEWQVQFFFEKRTELYMRYCSGAPQKKIAHDAKSDLQRWALPSLERRGA